MHRRRRIPLHGYAGRLLRVDLGSGKSWVEPLDRARARRYLGGRGMGARILLDDVPRGCDPLGPENRLVFAMGPLAGTFAPGSGRFAVVAKSPATDGFGEAYTGGFVAHELKYRRLRRYRRAGRGLGVGIPLHRQRPRRPPAGGPLGGAGDARNRGGDPRGVGRSRTRIIGIGLAGEKKVRYACVMNDTDRAAGRTGLGAVMGAKNLKAIAIRGTGPGHAGRPGGVRGVALANLAESGKHPWLGDSPDSAGALGTAGGVEDLVQRRHPADPQLGDGPGSTPIGSAARP